MIEKNRLYWLKRAEQQDKLAKKEEDEIIKEVAKLYEEGGIDEKDNDDVS